VGGGSGVTAAPAAGLLIGQVSETLQTPQVSEIDGQVSEIDGAGEGWMEVVRGRPQGRAAGRGQGMHHPSAAAAAGTNNSRSNTRSSRQKKQRQQQ
jgi:hypothetical protein